MALNKKLFNTASEDTITPSQHFQTVLYEGTGATQKVGSYINEGAQFDSGNTSYINLNSLDFPVNDFTVSVWVKLFTVSSSSGYDMILTTAKQNSGGYFYLTFDNNVLTYYETGAGGSVTSSTTVNANQWYHVVLTKSSSDGVKLYLDNVSVGSNSGYTSNNTANTTSGGLNTIGWYNTGSSTTASFDGLMDQFRIFSKALSTSEITTLYGETYSSTSKSVTDIFGDRSALALYQFENSAKDTGGASGYYGEGAIFNGSSSHIDIPSPIPYTNTDFSFTAWLYLNSSFSSGFKTIIGAGDKTTGEGIFRILIRYSSSNNYTIEPLRAFSGNSYYSSTSNYSAQTINEKTWFHLVFTYTASSKSANIYLNGSSVSSTNLTNTSTDATNSGVLALGQYRDSSSGYWDGKMDEIRIYSDVLTSTEVGHIYNNTTASIPTDNLEAYYKFEGSAQDEQQQYDGTSTDVIYRYDGTSSNVSFQGSTNFAPDFIWIKSRTEGTSSYTGNHFLYDSVRGVLKRIKSNSQDSETTFSNSLTAFNSNGFTVGSAIHVNEASDLYVAWCFRGGGSSNTFNINDTGYGTASAASLDGGQATPSGASINRKSGLGIYKVNTTTAARTMSHGLPSTPKMYIFKATGKSQNWYVSAYDGSNWKFGNLNNDSALSTTTTYTADSSNIVIGAGGSTTEIVYAMCDISNFQKIGTYTGNGDSIGAIVQTDFEVGWLLIRQISGSGNHWVIKDNKRSRTNPRQERLKANKSDAENTGADVDFLTNGFQIKSASNEVNGDTETYLYWAIATDPSTAATPTVTKSFDVVTWTGDGSNRDIESDISPDLVWGKRRDNAIGNTNHFLFDTLRGVESRLMSNSDSAETVISDEVTGFNTKGFSVGVDPSTNGNSGSMVAWLWSAGSHEGNLPTANTDGGVKSTVTANAAAGFSISRVLCPSSEQDFNWGHGLGAKPDMVLMKKINSTGNWFFWHKDLTAEQNYLYLNSSLNEGGLTQDARIWGNQTFTSTTVSTRSNYTFSNDDDVICYSWAEISGYSSIGSYTGNGNSTGTIVYTTDDGTSSGNNGFKPRFLLLKCINSSGTNWRIIDSMRDKTNARSNYFNADTAQPEETAYDQVDFLDNGFQLRTTDTSINGSGNTMIYYAVK